MICPAILDPFQGANYRINACIHQAMLCPIVSKAFGYFFSPRTASQLDETNNAAAGESNAMDKCRQLSESMNCSNGTSDKQNNDVLIAADGTIKKTK